MRLYLAYEKEQDSKYKLSITSFDFSNIYERANYMYGGKIDFHEAPSNPQIDHDEETLYVLSFNIDVRLHEEIYIPIYEYTVCHELGFYQSDAVNMLMEDHTLYRDETQPFVEENGCKYWNRGYEDKLVAVEAFSIVIDEYKLSVQLKAKDRLTLKTLSWKHSQDKKTFVVNSQGSMLESVTHYYRDEMNRQIKKLDDYDLSIEKKEKEKQLKYRSDLLEKVVQLSTEELERVLKIKQ